MGSHTRARDDGEPFPFSVELREPRRRPPSLSLFPAVHVSPCEPHCSPKAHTQSRSIDRYLYRLPTPRVEDGSSHSLFILVLAPTFFFFGAQATCSRPRNDVFSYTSAGRAPW